MPAKNTMPLSPYANETDKAFGPVLEKREQDWRNGSIVYQVIVDRFAPSSQLKEKQALYAPPKKIRNWDETPTAGSYLKDVDVWSHEIDFWGGDLQSLTNKLDYIKNLGVDVLYLNPIHLGYTNHKYDALDYLTVSPDYGRREDVKKLADDVHRLDMKLVLDGVFNHMGRNSAVFQKALANPKSPYRDWFHINDKYEHGYLGWADVANLPELNLENKAVCAHIYADRDSVTQGYLRDGIDGWRLDVAYDLGFVFLDNLTRTAHQCKPGSLIIGEIWNYPKEWFPSVDGVMNFTAREIILCTLQGDIPATQAGEMFKRMIDDAGIEPILKSWLLLDNHDTKRLTNTLPKKWQQRMAQVLQFTLPGSPNLYYGTELGMRGDDDPEQRAPMRWDLVTKENATLNWTRKLIRIRKQNRALRIGNFRLLTSKKLLAFERYTDRVGESIIVVANPSAENLSETIMLANSKITQRSNMFELLSKNDSGFDVRSALLKIRIPAHTTMLFKPDIKPQKAYTPYKRMQ